MKSTFYKCEACGLLLEAVSDGNAVPECCGKEMTALVPNSVDASREKHVPVIESDGDGIIVKIGSEPHPMEPEHFIMWIQVANGDMVERKYLHPGDSPEAKFSLPLEGTTAWCYCNIHGLWISEGKND